MKFNKYTVRVSHRGTIFRYLDGKFLNTSSNPAIKGVWQKDIGLKKVGLDE